MTNPIRLAMTSLVLATAAVAVLPVPTEAADRAYRGRYDRYAPPPAYVVAESRFGHGTVSGPVRHGRVGPEVMLPGGTWLPCKRSCSETLRVSTVDFWENQGQEGRVDNECGLLGCLSRGMRF